MNWSPGKIIVTIVVAAMVIASVAGGIILLDDNQSHGERAVTDSMGRTVYVPNDIKTIFCEDCCTLEVVSWFESVDKVCGIDSRDKIVQSKTYTQVFKERFSSLPVIDVSNAESVIRLNPSIVICSTADSQKISEKQNLYGVPVFYINADIEFNSDSWYTQITKLGQLLHEESRAKEIVDGVKEIRNELSKYDYSGSRAYVCGMMYYGSGNYLKTTGNYIPFDWIRLTNVMPPKGMNGQPYNTTAENLASVDFDYVFIDGSNINSVRNELKEFKETIAPNKTAFVNGDIYSTLTYKIWGTQWDNVLMNCFYVKHIVTGEDTLKDDVNRVLRLFYGDDITYDDLKQWNPNSFEKVIL